MKCINCNNDFPNHLINPFISTQGTFMVCPICALYMRNKMHGLDDTQFQGEQANELLKEARNDR